MYGSENHGWYDAWKRIEENPHASGIFVWTGIAYLGEAGPWPWKGLQISMFDFACNITPRGHLFRTLWREEPYIYLATKHAQKAQWQLKDGRFVDVREENWLNPWLFEDVDDCWNYDPGDTVFVEVYANTPDVELFVNDTSFGVKKNADFADRLIKYRVPYQAGKITAHGLTDGHVVTRYTLQTAGPAHAIHLQTDRKRLSANGMDAAHVDITIVDAHGVRVPHAEVDVNLSVQGPARLIGVDNGWDRSVQPAKSDRIVTRDGKALAIFQAGTQTGVVQVKACSKELKSSGVAIDIEAF